LNIHNFSHTCHRILQNPDARWSWKKKKVHTLVGPARVVVEVEVEVEVEGDLVDGVEVGAGVEEISVEVGVDTTREVEVVIQALRGEVAVGVDTRELEVVIQALRVEVAVGVGTTGELVVAIQALRAGVIVTEEGGGARIERVLLTGVITGMPLTGTQTVIQALKVGVDITRKLEVMIQALKEGTDITVKKEILLVVGIKEGIQVMIAEAARTRIGEVDQGTLIRLAKES
jgi:hypothetical protein